MEMYERKKIKTFLNFSDSEKSEKKKEEVQ